MVWKAWHSSPIRNIPKPLSCMGSSSVRSRKSVRTSADVWWSQSLPSSTQPVTVSRDDRLLHPSGSSRSKRKSVSPFCPDIPPSFGLAEAKPNRSSSQRKTRKKNEPRSMSQPHLITKRPGRLQNPSSCERLHITAIEYLYKNNLALSPGRYQR